MKADITLTQATVDPEGWNVNVTVYSDEEGVAPVSDYRYVTGDEQEARKFAKDMAKELSNGLKTVEPLPEPINYSLDV